MSKLDKATQTTEVNDRGCEACFMFNTLKESISQYQKLIDFEERKKCMELTMIEKFRLN